MATSRNRATNASNRPAVGGADGWRLLEDAAFPDVFGLDHTAHFTYKKTQRVVAACYLVTDALPENEPLKHRIRADGLALLSNVLRGLQGGGRRDTDRRACRSSMTSLVSVLDIGYTNGYISEMNYTVIVRECARLDQMFAGAAPHGGADISEFLFDTGAGEPRAAAARTAAPAAGPSSARDIKDTVSKKDTKGQYKDTEKRKETRKDTQSKRQIKDTSSGGGTNDRRAAILEVARAKGRINVKDVSRVIVDCSEKTLQRELLALVREGTLRKEGERRWSTYVLAE